MQGGLMGVAGRFPPAYMGAMVQGQALGGIIAVTTNIIMLAVGLNDVDAAFYDFLIAIFYLALSLVAFLYVTKTEFYKVIFVKINYTVYEIHFARFYVKK